MSGPLVSLCGGKLVALANSHKGQRAALAAKSFFDSLQDDSVAPSAGLDESVHVFESDPDSNTVTDLLVRPQRSDPVPCVYYIHGGAMRQGSCFDGMYVSWSRLIARFGVAVAMVDFRNSLIPSTSTEVAPFPAGLNDCVSGIRWLQRASSQLGID